MTPPLSPRTKHVVEKLFRPHEISEASRWLEQECGNNLPFCKDYDETKMERIRFAVLKLSNGDPQKLVEAIALAKRDWRDVLVWAGFGNDLEAHNRWMEELRGGEREK